MIALDIALLASTIGDTSRVKMLMALMGGKALTATELAIEANITPQTASSHLQKMCEQNIINLERQSRHKYFQIAGVEVAEMLEKLAVFANKNTIQEVNTGPKNPDLRRARICYDHLAGKLAVQLFDSLLLQQYIKPIQQHITLSGTGKRFFENLGADIKALEAKKRPLCKSCLDWSERKQHLAGALGKWILQDIQTKGWAVKDLDSRVIRFSPQGFKAFEQRYKLR